MDFWILGPLEVRCGGTQVALGAAKQRALLAILLVHANELVASDRLIEELWPKPPETAANALQVYVGKLRKALEPERARGAAGEILVTRAPGYILRVEPGELDAERFERLLSEGRAAIEADDVALGISLEQAVFCSLPKSTVFRFRVDVRCPLGSDVHLARGLWARSN